VRPCLRRTRVSGSSLIPCLGEGHGTLVSSGMASRLANRVQHDERACIANPVQRDRTWPPTGRHLPVLQHVEARGSMLMHRSARGRVELTGTLIRAINLAAFGFG
jgi:hypothetical protein